MTRLCIPCSWQAEGRISNTLPGYSLKPNALLDRLPGAFPGMRVVSAVSSYMKAVLRQVISRPHPHVPAQLQQRCQPPLRQMHAAPTATFQWAATQPQYARGLQTCDHLLYLLGLSPGNSLFSAPRTLALVQWMGSQLRPAGRLALVVPSTPNQHNFAALGRADLVALAHKECKKLIRRTLKAYDTLPPPPKRSASWWTGTRMSALLAPTNPPGAASATVR